MTITTTTTVARFVGNNSTTVFSYAFRILAATDLVVTKRLAATLVESTLSYPSDYTVSGVGNATGGSITLTVAPATGDLLVIERSTARTQATSIRNNSSYFAETHETVFDKLTMLVQENTNSLGRTFTLPHTLDPASYNMNLPVPVAGQVPIWTTNGLTNGSISSGSVVLPGQGRDTTTLTQYLANNYVYNVLDYDADPTGVADSTAAIHTTRDAAGSAAMLHFPPGTYIVTGLVASVANQQWHLAPGATLKMKDATNGAIVTISAADVWISGRGVLEGNRSTQSSDTATGVTLANGADRALVGDGLTIQNCRGIGVYCSLTAGQSVTSPMIRNCRLTGNARASDNHAQIWLIAAGGTLTAPSVYNCDIDGTPNHNGGIKISATGGGQVFRSQVVGNRCKVGDAGVGADTLGIEHFTDSTSFIKGVIVYGNDLVGENGTNTRVFGISLGGTAGTAGTTGIHGFAITGNRVQDCRSMALELIASNGVASGNTAKNSGRLHIHGGAITGGIADIVVSGYTVESCSDTSYTVYLDGDATGGLSRCTLQGISMLNSAGPGIVIGAGGSVGVLSHIYVRGVTASGLASVPVLIHARLSDSEICNVDADVTGTAGANVDGIYSDDTVGARVKFIRNRIKGATRHGVFLNAAVTDYEFLGNYVTGATTDGIHTTGGSGFVFDDNRCDSNGGTGILLAGSPSVKRFTDNRALSNVTAQINKGSATFTATPRGNQSSTGANSGRAVLVGGTVTVSTAEVIAADNIMLTRVVTGGTQGTLTVGTITAGTSFVITSSSGTDTSTIYWSIDH